MLLATVELLATWENFYVVVGTAAATLTGLMFVAITLSAGIRRRTGVGDTLNAFNTPNVVHFCVTLFISALLSAPWPELVVPGILLALVGLGGVVYVAIILRRFRRQRNYTPVLEDWLWHIIIPFACYIGLFIAALMLLGNPALAMFFVGAVTVLFLFVGIHNSWDIVVYITVELPRLESERQDSEAKEP